MACFMPSSCRNLEICFFVFRPTVVLVEDLMEGLKSFCLCTESLGCLHSAVFTSIHGNMIIWYGAWMKRSKEEKELLSASLLSLLTNVSTMAILIDHSFFDPYAGESRQGCPAACIFFNGDIISMNSTTVSSSDETDDEDDLFSYACLAIFRTRFPKMEGATAGFCLKSQSRRRVMAIFIWSSLQSCYSYILNTDCRKTIMPYLDGLPHLDIKYDVFRVVYASGVQNNNIALNLHLYPSQKTLENAIEAKDGCKVVQDSVRQTAH